MLKEFKEFAIKGNMVDMAVGIVIGAAFGTVMKSLVDDILMPIVSSVFGIPDFSNMFMVLQEAPGGGDFGTLAALRDAGGVGLGWGLFINSLLAFLLVALALFFVVKGVNKVQKAKEEEAGPTSEDLLTEIRDTLRARN